MSVQQSKGGGKEVSAIVFKGVLQKSRHPGYLFIDRIRETMLSELSVKRRQHRNIRFSALGDRRPKFHVYFYLEDETAAKPVNATQTKTRLLRLSLSRWARRQLMVSLLFNGHISPGYEPGSQMFSDKMNIYEWCDSLPPFPNETTHSAWDKLLAFLSRKQELSLMAEKI